MFWKRKTRKLFSLLMTSVLTVALCVPAGIASASESAPADASPTGAVLNFDDAGTAASGWGSDNQYKLTPEEGALKVEGSKNDIWAAFTYNLPAAVDISQHPYATIRIKTDIDMNFSMYLWDSAQQYSYPKVTPFEVVHAGEFTEITFDFTGQPIDLTNITSIALIANPSTGFKGTFRIDDLKLGDQAAAAVNMTNVQPQTTWINAPEQSVLLRNIRNSLGGNGPITLTAVSSDTSLIPDPTIAYSGGQTATLNYTPAQDLYGNAAITVTAEAGGISRSFVFPVSVERNAPPIIAAIDDVDVRAGEAQSIPLSGIDDGNSGARQHLTLTASSSNPDVVPNPVVHYNSDDRWGTLVFTPPADATGDADITVNVSDDGGTAAGGSDSATMTFHVRVFGALNHTPTIGAISDVIMDENGTATVKVTGLSDGDGGTQQLTVTAVSSDGSIVPAPSIAYVQGESTALLTLQAAGAAGEASITVTAADNGGGSSNNGNLSATSTFLVKVRVAPLLGLTENFDDGTFSSRWGNNGNDGVHTLSVQDGVLRLDINKGNYPWAGLWYSLPKEMDLSTNPYISIKMKTDQPSKDVMLFLWDANGKYTTGTPGSITKSVTGDMTQYEYDFNGHFNSADGSKLDPTRITAIMWTFAPAESNWQGTFYFDDFQVGNEADKPPISVTLDDVPDMTLSRDASLQTVGLTGLSNGAGDRDGVSVTAVSSNPELIPDPTASAVADGSASLSFTPAAGQTGSAVITVTASASGSANIVKTFKVNVLDTGALSPVGVTINRARTFQTMDGMGGFVSSDDQPLKTEQYVQMANDLGVTIARFGVIDQDFEPVNDNSDPNVTNYAAFNTDAVPWRTIKTFKEQTSVDKFILTMWSPAWWLKKNKWVSAQDWATDNVIDPIYYKEYAEELVAIVKTVKEKAGVDLYGISLQNEPEFNEPYASAKVSPTQYRDLIKVVGPLFKAEGLTTKIFMPEALIQQNHLADYVNAINSDPDAAPYVDIFAVHNYDADGIHVGGPGADGWKLIKSLSLQEPAKKRWMTETSGMPGTWDGGMVLAANIYQALYYGDASAWVFWHMGDNFNTNGRPNSLYAVSKQFYKYIQPGMTRIGATSQSGDVLSLAFEDPATHRFSTVLINTGTEAHLVSLQGSELPDSYAYNLSSQGRSFEPQAEVTDGQLLLPANSIATLYSDEALAPPSDDTEAPSAPGGVTATANDDGTVALNWTASTDNVGVSGYDVYAGTQKLNNAIIAATSYTATGLVPLTDYTFTVKARDGADNESAASAPVTVRTKNGGGGLVREYWLNLGGGSITDIPLNTPPSGRDLLTSFEAPTNWNDNYGARIRGYVKPSQTGDYTFYIASDDNSELWLSSDNDPANKQKIASVSGFTSPNEWSKMPSQQSAAVTLTAGTSYYIEALHKEGGGGDNLSVGWKGPGISAITVIPGANLSPYAGEPTGEDSEAPGTPANVQASGITANAVTLTWDASTDNVGVAGYDIYNGSTKMNAQPVTTTSFQITGLTPSTAYSFTVRARDAAGNESAASSPVAITTTADSGDNGGLLAYSPFDAPVGQLQGITDGIGWRGPWQVQNANTDVPGYNIAADHPLSYPLLDQSGRYAIGGSQYLTAYRDLDRTDAFKDYVVDERIGKPGTTLYYSGLVRYDKATDLNMWVGFGDIVTPYVSAGFYGEPSKSNGTRFWSLKLGNQIIKTTKPVLLGEAALLVVKVELGSTNRVSLYVNPAGLGGTSPAAADAQAESADNLTFRAMNFYAGDNPGTGSVDELRVGKSFADVTPAIVDAEAPGAPTGLTASSQDASSVTLSWAASTDNVGVAGYDVYDDAVKINTDPITSTTFTVSGLETGSTHNFTVKAFDASGNMSQASEPLTVHLTAASSEETLALSASRQLVAVGETFQVTVNDPAASQVNGFQLTVGYDPTQFKLVGYHAAPEFAAANEITLEKNGSEGSETLTGALLEAGQSKSGDLPLLVLEFKAIGTAQPGQITLKQGSGVTMLDESTGVTSADSPVSVRAASADIANTGDGVNIGDLIAIAAIYNKPEAYNARMDMNGDGVIDAIDLTFVADVLFGQQG